MREQHLQDHHHSQRDVSTSIGIAFNPLSGPELGNPYPFYAVARRQEPIFFSPLLQAWVITRYEDVKAVLRDPKRFSSAYLDRLGSAYTPETQAILSQGISNAEFLLISDPPGHTRARQPLTKAFSARRIASLEPAVRHIATHLLEELLPLGQADLVTQFAAPFPLLVIFRLLGLPEHDLQQLRRWAEEFVALIYSFLPPEQQLSCAKSYLAFQHYLLAFLEQRRLAPQDDFTSDLLSAVAEEEVQLSSMELVGILLSLVSAGVNTTADVLGSCVYHLLTQDQYWQAIQQDPDLLAAVVEEALRFDGPAVGLFRVTTEEVELNGVALPKDALVYIAFGSANHDEALFATPETFDPYRSNLKEHLAFGYGIHFCIGAALARLELRVALECLSRLLPSVRLVPGQQIQYQPSAVLRGPAHLLIEWERRS